MQLAKKRSFFNETKSSVLPFIWFDAIDNIGKNRHSNSSLYWQSIGQLDCQAMAQSVPSWGDNYCSFQSTSQMMELASEYSKQLGTDFTINITLMPYSGMCSQWHGICGGQSSSEYGIATRGTSDSSYFQFGTIYGGSVIFNVVNYIKMYNQVISISFSQHTVGSQSLYRCFANGSKHDETTLDMTAPEYKYMFWIGSGWEGRATDQMLLGKLFDIKMFNTILTDDEIIKVQQQSISRYSL